MKSYISVNIVSQALLLMKSVAKHSIANKKQIKQLKLPYGVNAESSMEFAIQCGWFVTDGDAFSFSDTGNKVEKLFNGEYISTDLWKSILLSYIMTCRPVWAARIPYGRKEAFLIMNEEEQRCFIEAGLIDSHDDDVITWWDSIADLERTKAAKIKDDIGRVGEKLTLQYEEKRTGVRPDWRSIETNMCGYDILSQRSSDDIRKVLIEVKSSTRNLENAYAIISRNEWETACLSNNNDRYFFYLWKLGPQNHLAIISANQMRLHIPVDQENGIWESVRVPFSAFQDCFFVV